MPVHIFLEIKPRISIEKIKKIIQEKYKIVKIGTERFKVEYFDTFDWRLYRNNYFLSNVKDCLQLDSVKKKNSILSLNISQMSLFAFDLPESRLKNIVAKLTQVRALLSLARISINRSSYNLLDDNDKIVVRLNIDAYSRIGRFVYIEALRGFDSHVNSISSLLSDNVLKANKKRIFEKSLEINSKKPGDYDPRIKIELKPDLPSQKATKIILKNLLNTLIENEQGIINDIDSEFLHDFRVASRRTRAALSQIKYVFDQELTDLYNDQFKSLGKRTNNLRDIDVYLLNQKNYKNRLPQKLKKSVEPFFDELQNERKLEQKKLSKYLRSKNYKDQIANWNNFLNTDLIKTLEAKNSNLPIFDLASSFILQQYNKIMKLGKKITSNSPDTLYHQLRIQCKKLRYLLEFFRSLFLEDQIDLLILQLKKLQDNLGLFNDLYVQQETLKEYCKNRNFDTEVILSLGFLVGKFNQEQIEIRKYILQDFGDFSSKKTENLINRLFI